MTTTSPHPASTSPAHPASTSPAQPELPGARSWPDIPPAPRGAARALAARALVRRVATRLPIRIQAPDGTRSGAGGPGSPILEIRHQDEFYRRLGGGTTGLAEGYIAGDWDSPDLVGLFAVLAGHLPALTRGPVRTLRRWYVPAKPAEDEATIDGARRNIQRHYDLSNEMFALFLDPTMTYSSALFAPGDTLAAAQRRKNDTLLDLTGVGPATSVLEIGTGWGELAICAAARGAQVTTLTVSPAQAAMASERAAAAGLADLVDVRTLDYREATGRYDVILSVEMIEAVGESYWPGYFAAIDRLLAPGGRVGLQVITMPHDAMVATRHGHTWIQKYIFPGGQIPSLPAIGDVLRAHTALRISSDLSMGAHYARTLGEWRARFAAATDELSRLGFGPAFQRMWNLYLAYSEAGFRARYLDVHQLILQPPMTGQARMSRPAGPAPTRPW